MATSQQYYDSGAALGTSGADAIKQFVQNQQQRKVLAQQLAGQRQNELAQETVKQGYAIPQIGPQGDIGIRAPTPDDLASRRAAFQSNDPNAYTQMNVNAAGMPTGGTVMSGVPNYVLDPLTHQPVATGTMRNPRSTPIEAPNPIWNAVGNWLNPKVAQVTAPPMNSQAPDYSTLQEDELHQAALSGDQNAVMEAKRRGYIR